MTRNKKYLSWEKFDSNQEKYAASIVILTNDDFLDGTLKILYPCTLVLTEDIIFDPMGKDKLNPYYEPEKSKNAKKYTYAGYRLGFFAAIAIESNDVIVDLNGYEIKQSKRHNLLQRFYSHIELANQPFIPAQGPANFGSDFIAATDCVIKNGYLGLSSHHCIHGNNNDNIKIYGVRFVDYEVGAIGLNGIQNLCVANCCFDGNYKNIPTNGLFSASVFIRKFAKKAIEYASIDSAKNDIQEKLDKLEVMIQKVLDLTLSDSEDKPHKLIVSPDDDIEFLVNPSGLPDGGTTYTIVINGHGVAVNNFAYQELKDDDYKTKNIKFKNIEIKNLEANPTETIALSGENGEHKIQVDTAGSVLPIATLIDNNGHYKGTILSDLQIALAKWSSQSLSIADPVLVEHRKNKHFGTLNIHDAIIAWACENIVYEHNGTQINSFLPFSEIKEIMGFNYIYNGDSMFHVIKGVMGIRIDTALDVVFDDIVVSEIKNIGDHGKGIYSGANDGGHYAQAEMVGYCGTDVYGIKCSGCKNTNLYDLCIKHILSVNGSAYGLSINDISKYVIGFLYIKDVQTTGKEIGVSPNKLPIAIGFYSVNVKEREKTCECSYIKIRFIWNKYIPYNSFNTADSTIDYDKDIIPLENMNQFKTYHN